ncbi:hypothetical protein F4777DRAFT_578857 [Nemania sp. FL0916]|nr:hypothetical protein F4777DRAFT_578857 [Nemania sp. FL0916]
MGLALLSKALSSEPFQMAIYTLRDLVLLFLLQTAKILQGAETWVLNAVGAPTHTIRRMFPPEDISEYTRVEAQIVALIELVILISVSVRGYLAPHPPRKSEWDTYPWYGRASVRATCLVGHALIISRFIAIVHIIHPLIEASEDTYRLVIRMDLLISFIAISSYACHCAAKMYVEGAEKNSKDNLAVKEREAGGYHKSTPNDSYLTNWDIIRLQFSFD